jgi:endonuclease/exonuclease/phosphatase family metal-dependent hydrolase
MYGAFGESDQGIVSRQFEVVIMLCSVRLLLFALLTLTPLELFAEAPRLRVLTYNIHHGEGTDRKFDLERLAKIIKTVEPDVVAVQEVDRKTRRASGADQAAELGRLTGMHAEFGKAMDYSGGEYGEAILSRHKPTNVKVHALPHGPGREPRAAIAITLAAHDGLPELIFIGTHLCHQSNEDRVAQAKKINDAYPADPKTVAILAGDLNARSDTPPMHEFGKQWTDTMPKRNKIDYVLVRPDDPWRVVEAKVIPEPVASDHDPVLVMLEWRGGAE